ncbi:MAG: hypothetical protein V3U14_13050 [candidate division NC10 bacterium]
MPAFHSATSPGKIKDPKVAAILAADGIQLDADAAAVEFRHFGTRDDFGTSELTVALLAGEAHETFLATNGITHIISTSTADITETIHLEGYTLSGGLFTRVAQDVALNGRTAVALSTPIARVNHAVNTSATAIAGTISVYEGGSTSLGVVDDATEVHLQIAAGRQLAEDGSAVVGDEECLVITHIMGSILKKQAAFVDVTLESRALTGQWLHMTKFALASTGTSSIVIVPDPPIVVEANTDIRLTAVASTTGVEVTAMMSGWRLSLQA